MADGSLLFDTKLDTSGISSGLSKLGGVASVGLKATTAAVGAASTAIVGFGKSAVDAGMTFDSSMSQVAATMGVTVDEIGDLRDFAQQMGSTTAFSASEAADALNYMALAGYDAETSMQMLPNVLNLAAAGGIDLASASDMVTDAQTALGLSLEETSIMVDQMAAASSNTNTSVAQLGEAFLTIGGNAKNLSGGTQELSQMLGVMADNGIKGAEAGTHLRNIMLAMNPTTDAACAAWEKLGISAYDANGELRDLPTVFQELNAAMDGMTDQEKTDMLSDMFNKTDLAAVNALLDTTADRYDEVAAAIEDSAGASQKMAETQLDNLSGDITLFKSALEGAQIAVADQLTPTLREFVQFGSDGLSRLTEAFNENGMSGAMEVFGELLSEAVTAIIEMLPELVNAAMMMLEAIGQGLMDNLPVLLDAAIQVVVMLCQFLLDNLPALIDAAFQIILTLANGIAQSIPELIPQIIAVVIQICNTLIENLPLLIEAAIQIFLGIITGLIQALPQIIEAIPTLIDSIINALINSIPLLVDCGVQLFVALIQNLPAIIVAIVKAVPEIVNSIIKGFTALFGQMKTVGSDLITKVKEGLLSMASNIVAEAKNIGGNIVDGIKNGISAGWEKLKSWVGDLASSLFDSAKSALGIASPSKKFRYLGEMCVAGFDDGIEGLMDGDAIGASINASLGTISANVGAGLAGGAGASQTFNFYDTQTSPDAIRRKVQNTMTFGLAGGI